MKKFITISLSAFIATVFTAMSFGQAVVFEDNFDTYTVGGQLACQNPIDWTTWSNAPCGSEDVFISDNYAYSGTNSFVVAPNNDLVKPLGTLTLGKWDIRFMVYVPAGKAGYFNCESEFATWWALDAYFNPGGTGELFAGSTTPISFPYLHNAWQSVRVFVDLELDSAKFWIEGVFVHSWKWTLGSVGQGGPLQLDVVDFWGATANDEMYVDDFEFWDMIVPVELTSFTATSQMGKVYLNWTTATELNNLGFEIERKILNNQNEGEWVRIGFVEGHGTTTEIKEYSYIDDINAIQASSLVYRLKQIDFLGSYEYSDEVLVDNPAPIDYALYQNYPNPFNPTTSIKHVVAVKSHIVIKVFNALGSEVATLANGVLKAGTYEVEFNATNLPSGIYFYTLQAGSFIETKKMVLMK
jgi:hypothetical protein